MLGHVLIQGCVVTRLAAACRLASDAQAREQMCCAGVTYYLLRVIKVRQQACRYCTGRRDPLPLRQWLWLSCADPLRPCWPPLQMPDHPCLDVSMVTLASLAAHPRAQDDIISAGARPCRVRSPAGLGLQGCMTRCSAIACPPVSHRLVLPILSCLGKGSSPMHKRSGMRATTPAGGVQLLLSQASGQTTGALQKDALMVLNELCDTPRIR